MPRSVARHRGQVQPAGAVLDEHQYVQPLEQYGLRHEEVTGDDRMRLRGQELQTASRASSRVRPRNGIGDRPACKG